MIERFVLVIVNVQDLDNEESSFNWLLRFIIADVYTLYSGAKSIKRFPVEL